MDKIKEAWTISSILTWTVQYFKGKGVDNPRLDAEVLLSHILCQDRLYLYVHFDQPLQASELSAFRKAVKQRAARKPVAYITGSKEFMGLNFAVTPAVLIPRPDTEILVEAVLARLRQLTQPRFLDLGTGSGAIAVSLLHHWPQAQAVAVDISAAALAVAKANGDSHGVADRLECRQGDWFEPVAGQLFDVIVSNPPYIPAQDISGLSPEVRCEPVTALAGGADGLDFYRRLAAYGRSYLRPGGCIAVEVGCGQAAAVAAMADERFGLKLAGVLKDYASIERVTLWEAV